MNSNNPQLQQLICNLNQRNREASEWKNTFAEKLVAQLNKSKEKK